MNSPLTESDINTLGNTICNECQVQEFSINLANGISLKFMYGQWYLYHNDCQRAWLNFDNKVKMVSLAIKCLNGFTSF